MLLPWYMHCHGGQNTLVGTLPTSEGVFVRSWVDGTYDVSWYPIASGRRVVHIGRFRPEANEPERDASESAIVDFMHTHPVLCTEWSYDEPTEALEWAPVSHAMSMHRCEDGTYVATTAGAMTTLRHLPADGGAEIEICSISSLAGDERTTRRLNARITRHRRALAKRNETV
jgi:hypothetical protein